MIFFLGSISNTIDFGVLSFISFIFNFIVVLLTPLQYRLCEINSCIASKFVCIVLHTVVENIYLYIFYCLVFGCIIAKIHTLCVHFMNKAVFGIINHQSIICYLGLLILIYK